MKEKTEKTDKVKSVTMNKLTKALEEGIRSALTKLYGSDDNFDVILNPKRGELEIYRSRIVVADGEVSDENKEVALSDARRIVEEYEIGECISESVYPRNCQ